MVGESSPRWKGLPIGLHIQKHRTPRLDSRLWGPSIVFEMEITPFEDPLTPGVRGELVLVSACLAGCACRYDGQANPNDEVARLVAEGRAVQVCPEEDGGLPTPRPPAEIVGGDGHDVLAGRAKVMTKAGQDVTQIYIEGADRALEAARAAGATRAILKSRSPSCGKGVIYDGTFSRTTTTGDGVTAALLAQNGIELRTESDV